MLCGSDPEITHPSLSLYCLAVPEEGRQDTLMLKTSIDKGLEFDFYSRHFLVMGRTPFYRTLNKLKHHFSDIERVHLLVIKLEHLNFGFEWTDIEHWTLKAFNRFPKLFIAQTQTSFFRTSNRLEHVHLLVIELEHPFLASNDRTSNFKHSSTHHYIVYF